LSYSSKNSFKFILLDVFYQKAFLYALSKVALSKYDQLSFMAVCCVKAIIVSLSSVFSLSKGLICKLLHALVIHTIRKAFNESGSFCE
jgi:hypothetical protein